MAVSVNLRLLNYVITVTALTLILTKPGMTGATAGFILTFAGTISSRVNWLLTNIRTFELKGVSLERTAEYRALDKEDGIGLDENIMNTVDGKAREAYLHTARELEGWPSHGSIEVSQLRARYGPELPDILHDVSFDVQGGQRIGIVGATGGGKSTLAKAFFSFVDVTNGSIKIDGKGEPRMSCKC
jgi:ABC-type multidrug transport system fused ATPase/permease subunit